MARIAGCAGRRIRALRAAVGWMQRRSARFVSGQEAGVAGGYDSIIESAVASPHALGGRMMLMVPSPTARLGCVSWPGPKAQSSDGAFPKQAFERSCDISGRDDVCRSVGCGPLGTVGGPKDGFQCRHRIRKGPCGGLECSIFREACRDSRPSVIFLTLRLVVGPTSR